MTRSRFLKVAQRALRDFLTLSVFVTCSLYPVSYTAAQGSAVATLGFKHGKVMARQLVLGPNGKPIFAEFDQAGEVASEIGEATEENKLQGALVMPGSTFLSMVASYDELRQRYADAVIMTRTQFEASTFALSQDNNATLERPPLASQVKTVLVRVSGTVNGRTLVPTHEFVLDTYPMVLPIQQDEATAQTLAVLIDSDGLVRRASNHNIGFRAAWVREHTSDVERDNNALRQSGETPLGPVAGALVYVAVNGTGDITGADGDYSVQHMILPCPGSSYEIQNAVVAELRTQNFNPRGTYVSTYAVQVPFYITCYGRYANLAAGPTLGAQSTFLDSEAIMATQASISPPLDIKIDVMSLAGQGVLSNDGTLNNAIPVAAETAYATAAVTFNPFNPTFLDLNSDGRADQTFLCGQNVKVYFEAPPADQDPCVAQADVTRLADRPADFTDQGLLRTITEADLEQTDLYVFRMSNGTLISERKGLKPPTTTYQSSGVSKNADGSASNQFFYNMLLRGPRDMGSANPMNTLSFSEWQTRSGIKDPALLERSADHLRVGEQIKIIAINRVTGYIGSVVTTLQNAAGNQSGALRIGADKIVLGPPNLRIKAERTSFVEAGLTKGEQRDYLIGFEGSALKSDHVIALSTEWVDVDGSPLPEGLPGYTGRLAKVVDGRSLGGLPPRNDLAEFEIRPGKRVQLIALPDDVAVSNDHFYLHVCAARYVDSTECAAHYMQNRELPESNPLRYRPKHYVPVRVPLYDEALTQLTKLQLRDSLSNAQSDAERQQWLDALRNADPNYRWPYRPEMQFSVFDLKMKQLNRTDADDTIIDIFPAGKDNNNQTIPGLASSDQQLQLLYDLVGSEFEVLPPFGPGRELVFALGEEELRAVVGTDGDLIFTNLEHLAALQPEDFLSLRLYQNSDPENVLWEFAFDVLFITPTEEDEFNEIDLEKHYVFADEPTLNLGAGLYSFMALPPDERPSVTMRWSVEGAGVLASPITRTPRGILFENKLTMPRTAGASAIVKVAVDSDSSLRTQYKQVFVLPGAAGRASLDLTGHAGIQGAGRIAVTATIRDSYGNLVLDGTPVVFDIEGHGELIEAQDRTTAGVARAYIRGGFLPETNGTLHVTSGDATASATYTTGVLQATVSGLPQAVQTDQLMNLTVAVNDASGAPASDVFVDVAATAGKLSYTSENLRTDALGRLSFLWHTGSLAGEGWLTVRLGKLQLVRQQVTIQPPPPQVGAVRVLDWSLLLLGDQTSDATVSHDQATGTQTGVTFAAPNRDLLRIQAPPGGPVEVQLGTDAYPNRAPLWSLRGERLRSYGFYDDTGQHKLTPKRLQRVYSHPSGLGSALNFARSTTVADLTAQDSHGELQFAREGLVNPQQPSWRLNLKPTAFGGTLVQYGGALGLVLAEDGAVVLSARGQTGTQSVRSAPVSLGAWHEVVAQVTSTELRLLVNGQLSVAPAMGPLNYNAPSPLAPADKVIVGRGFSGHLADMALYDLSSPSLLGVGGDASSATLVAGADGIAETEIVGRANLRYGAGRAGLRAVMVGVQVGTERISANVLSTQEYQSLASMVYDTLGQAPDAAMMKSLYADSTRYGADTVLVDRLLAQVSDARNAVLYSTGFTELKPIAGVLAALRRVPSARALVPHVQTLVDYFTAQSQGDAGEVLLYALADDLYSRIKPALRGQTADLEPVTLPLLILAEMVEQVPNAADHMARSIKSAEHYRAWMKFLALPAQGWVGLAPLAPPLESRCGDSAAHMITTSTPELSLPLLPCRLTGRDVGTLINELWAQIPELDSHPDMLPAVLGELVQVLPFADIDVRKFLFAQAPLQTTLLDQFSPVKEAHAAAPAVGALVVLGVRYALTQVAKTAAKRAIRNLFRFMMGKSNSRVPPILLMASIGYLESRITGAGCTGSCKRITSVGISKPIHSLQKRILTNFAVLGRATDAQSNLGSRVKCGFTYDTHGAAFELFVTAFFHLLDEQLGLSKFELVALQRRNEIMMVEPIIPNVVTNPVSNLYKEMKTGTNGREWANFVRYTDIVIRGDSDKPTYVELKSYAAHDNTRDRDTATRASLDRKVPYWTRQDKLAGTGTTLHRQLLLDTMLTTDNMVMLPGDDRPRYKKAASDFRWYFQSWPFPNATETGIRDPGNAIPKVRVRETGQNALAYVRERLSRFGADLGTARLTAWNADRELGFASDEAAMLNTVRRLGDGGLKKRVKEFSLLHIAAGAAAGEVGDEVEQFINPQQWKQVLKDGLGVDGPIADVISDPEKYKELAVDHLRNLGAQLAQSLADLTGGALTPEEILETYEELLKELQQNQNAIDDKVDEALEKLADTLPDTNPETCL